MNTAFRAIISLGVVSQLAFILVGCSGVIGLEASKEEVGPAAAPTDETLGQPDPAEAAANDFQPNDNAGGSTEDAAALEAVAALVNGCPADGSAGGSSALVSVDESKATVTGAWYQQSNAQAVNSGFKFITQTGALDIPFQGVCATVTALKCVNCGRMSIKVDGVLKATVDLYSPSDVWRADVYSTGTLPKANHTITVEWTGAKNSNSTNSTVTFDALRVDPGASTALDAGSTPAAGGSVPDAGSTSPDAGPTSAGGGGTTTAAKLLFRTSFGPGVTLSAPTNLSVGNAWQNITGTDQETGFTFPVKGLGSDATLLQLIGPYGKGGTALTYSNVNSFFGNKIQSVVGPKGNMVNELFLNLKIKEEPLSDGHSQVPLIIRRPWTVGDPDVYLSYWYKFPADLATKLDTSATGNNWRVMFEWKSGGWNNTGNGDYRMITLVHKGADGKFYWKNQWDNYGNLTKTQVSTWEPKIYWSERNTTVPVPIGKWFKFEVFWHRSSGSDGRYWTAVNGQKLTDHYGPNMGDFRLPVTRIMVNNAYTGGYGPVEGHLTDLQIWNGFPCGNGVSCP